MTTLKQQRPLAFMYAELSVCWAFCMLSLLVYFFSVTLLSRFCYFTFELRKARKPRGYVTCLNSYSWLIHVRNRFQIVAIWFKVTLIIMICVSSRVYTQKSQGKTARNMQMQYFVHSLWYFMVIIQSANPRGNRYKRNRTQEFCLLNTLLKTI